MDGKANPHSDPDEPGCVPRDWVPLVMWHILYQVYLLHKNGVVHGDLQMANLVMDEREVVMLQDFGSICSSTIPHENHLSGDRWYLSPELLLGTHYNEATDMWSLGCIFYEVYTNQPLFPGRNFEHQVELIVDQLGALPSSLSSAPQDPNCVERTDYPAHNVVRDINNDLVACDLLRRLVAYDPADRITARAALSHPFFTRIQEAVETVPHRLDAAFREQRRLFDLAKDVMGGRAKNEEQDDAAPPEEEEEFVQDYEDVAAYELDDYSDYEYDTAYSEDGGVQYSDDEQ